MTCTLHIATCAVELRNHSLEKQQLKLRVETMLEVYINLCISFPLLQTTLCQLNKTPITISIYFYVFCGEFRMLSFVLCGQRISRYCYSCGNASAASRITQNDNMKEFYNILVNGNSISYIFPFETKKTKDREATSMHIQLRICCCKCEQNTMKIVQFYIIAKKFHVFPLGVSVSSTYFPSRCILLINAV